MEKKEMRTRILTKMLQCEAEEYLKRNDIIIVPIGTVEPHGGFPLDNGTILSEAFARYMAEACDGLYLPGVPYFYCGATACGVGTTQVSIKEGTAYLNALAHSLLRQGFKRQIYVSCHGPSHMTCCSVTRDFFDETGIPILYVDMMKNIWGTPAEFKAHMSDFHAMLVGCYDAVGRLEEVPLTTEHWMKLSPEVGKFGRLSSMAAQNGAVGYYFAEGREHLPTPPLATEGDRKAMANKGHELIKEAVKKLEMEKVVEDMVALREYTERVMAANPHTPAAYNRRNPKNF